MCTGRALIAFIEQNKLEDVEVLLYVIGSFGIIEESTFLKLDLERDLMIEDFPRGKVLVIG